MGTLKIKVTEDKEHADRVRKALANRGGYCPCSLLRDEDTKCMCRTFREQREPGLCHCGLYEKVLEN